jgi:hypothetical protein
MFYQILNMAEQVIPTSKSVHGYGSPASEVEMKIEDFAFGSIRINRAIHQPDVVIESI